MLFSDPSDSEPATAKHRDLILDCWRGFSVLLVVIGHAISYRLHPYFADSGGTHPPSDLAGGLLHTLRNVVADLGSYIGNLGVQIFFVISGFIITALLMKEHQKYDCINLKAFYVRRACRILPPLCLVLAATAAATLAGIIDVPKSSFLSAALFSCNMVDCQFFLGHLWSLAVEEQFYIAWPIFIAALHFRNANHVAIGAIVALVFLAQVPGYSVSNSAIGFACIATGCLYATSPALRTFVARQSKPLLLLIALLWLIGKPVVPQLLPGQHRLAYTLQPLLVGFVVFGSREHGKRLATVKLVRLFAKLGLLSYGLYLWQQLFLGRPQSYTYAPSVAGIAALPLVVLLSYICVEKPAMKIGAALSDSMIRKSVLKTHLSRLPSRRFRR